MQFYKLKHRELFDIIGLEALLFGPKSWKYLNLLFMLQACIYYIFDAFRNLRLIIYKISNIVCTHLYDMFVDLFIYYWYKCSCLTYQLYMFKKITNTLFFLKYCPPKFNTYMLICLKWQANSSSLKYGYYNKIKISPGCSHTLYIGASNLLLPSNCKSPLVRYRN